MRFLVGCLTLCLEVLVFQPGQELQNYVIDSQISHSKLPSLD